MVETIGIQENVQGQIILMIKRYKNILIPKSSSMKWRGKT